MTSENQRKHLEKLSNHRVGKKNTKEMEAKRKETFRLKALKRIAASGERLCLKCGNKLTLTIYPSGRKEALCKFLKRSYCSLYCARHSEEFKNRFAIQNNGKLNGNWKGGKNFRENGYVELWIPNHPFANHDGYVLEHRIIMEKKLGRYLKPKEIVHHIDENTNNNAIDNLMLFKNAGYHISHHLRLKKYV
jgi:hypothetical protein